MAGPPADVLTLGEAEAIPRFAFFLVFLFQALEEQPFAFSGDEDAFVGPGAVVVLGDLLARTTAKALGDGGVLQFVLLHFLFRKCRRFVVRMGGILNGPLERGPSGKRNSKFFFPDILPLHIFTYI